MLPPQAEFYPPDGDPMLTVVDSSEGSQVIFSIKERNGLVRSYTGGLQKKFASFSCNLQENSCAYRRDVSERLTVSRPRYP